jgi:hypothetical protein
MKKVKTYKGYIIAELNKKEQLEKNTRYQVFSKDEWQYGENYRYAEFDDCGSIQECIDNIRSC